jgi:hypothetical protein
MRRCLIALGTIALSALVVTGCGAAPPQRAHHTAGAKATPHLKLTVSYQAPSIALCAAGLTTLANDLAGGHLDSAETAQLVPLLATLAPKVASSMRSRFSSLATMLAKGARQDVGSLESSVDEYAGLCLPAAPTAPPSMPAGVSATPTPTLCAELTALLSSKNAGGATAAEQRGAAKDLDKVAPLLPGLEQPVFRALANTMQAISVGGGKPDAAEKTAEAAQAGVVLNYTSAQLSKCGAPGSTPSGP